jgi:hypothetical protein
MSHPCRHPLYTRLLVAKATGALPTTLNPPSHTGSSLHLSIEISDKKVSRQPSVGCLRAPLKTDPSRILSLRSQQAPQPLTTRGNRGNKTTFRIIQHSFSHYKNSRWSFTEYMELYKLRRMRWAAHVARTGKRPHERPRRRLEDFLGNRIEGCEVD